MTLATATLRPDPSEHRCTKCGGSGIYRWGACINGKMSKEGPCFECEGKGYTTVADRRRTAAYWSHRATHEF